MNSLLISKLPLLFFTYSNTLPLDINGIMSRGISLSMHTPIRDITWSCLKDNMVDTSFTSVCRSPVEKRAVQYLIAIKLVALFFGTFSSFDCNKLIPYGSFDISPVNQSRFPCNNNFHNSNECTSIATLSNSSSKLNLILWVYHFLSF